LPRSQRDLARSKRDLPRNPSRQFSPILGNSRLVVNFAGPRLRYGSSRPSFNPIHYRHAPRSRKHAQSSTPHPPFLPCVLRSLGVPLDMPICDNGNRV
jgi:hypothetical protein